MNTHRTNGRRVTVGLPTMYDLIGKDGFIEGSFSSAQEAAETAKRWWPDQEQDEDRTGKGWDVQVVGP